MKLYVIGNGFDRAHGLKTSYWDFRTYLNTYAEEFLTEFEKLYGFYQMNFDHVPSNKHRLVKKQREEELYSLLWQSFEKSIGNPVEEEIQTTCDSAVDAMSDIEFGGIGDTLNAYFEDQFRFILELQDYLLRWTKQIRLNKATVMRKTLFNNTDDLFLTFNYTPVLERVYNINSSQICHIHGGIPPYCYEPPIIGHGNKDAIEKRRKWEKECEDEFDEGGASTNRAFAYFYQRTFKDTNKALLRHSGFFSKLKTVDEVYIIGHSLGKVDMPYFEEIRDRVKDDAQWLIYYHSVSEKDRFERSIRDIGADRILMEQSDVFWV